MSKFYRLTITFFIFFSLFFTFQTSTQAGELNLGPDTDADGSFILGSFFDLRDRESYIQVTNIEADSVVTHVQIFVVNDNCRENNFFDAYTGNDTHLYNMRDISSNDGNPTGVVLNDGDYGFVIVTATLNNLISEPDDQLIGNFRIVDELGYEYRTNSAGTSLFDGFAIPALNLSLNFNNEGGVSLSEVVSIAVNNAFQGQPEVTADSVNPFAVSDINIYDLNEVPFSCPNVITACIDQDNPRLEELLEAAANPPQGVGGANVASFEYGINDALPHSKGSLTACTSNIISQGILTSTLIGGTNEPGLFAAVYVGLNNGNGRGSMDGIWGENVLLVP